MIVSVYDRLMCSPIQSAIFLFEENIRFSVKVE